MHYKLALIIFNICCFIFICLMVAMLLFKVPYILFGALAVGIGFVGLIITAIFYRCPHCNSRLNVRDPNTPYCPYCGGKLEE